MSNLDSIETNGDVSREAAMFAYKKFIDQGITNPDDLDLDDPKVKAANELFYAWQERADSEAGESEDNKLRADLAKTMFYIDSGFTDPEYLDEVLKEWLTQSSEDAPQDSGNPERQETRRQIAEAMLKVKKLLAEKNT